MSLKIKYNLKSTKEVRSLLVAVCHYEGVRIKVSTGLTVLTAAWNKAKQRCEVGTMFSDRDNRASRKTNKFLEELDQKWAEHLRLNHPKSKSGYYGSMDFQKYTLKLFIDRLNQIEKEQEEKQKTTPTQYFMNYVNGIASKVNPRTGGYLSDRTQAHHRTVLKRVMDFMAYQHYKDDFSIFDSTFADNFTQWAYNKKKYKHNTIPATFSVMKVWLNAAHTDGFIDNIEFKKWTSKSTEVDNIYLTTEEIERIYNLDIALLKEKELIDKKSKIEITRDLFVISCWTGLRKNDINRLEEAVFDIDDENITIVTEKTKEKVTIPMHPFVKELWIKYNGHFPKLIDKSHVIKHLQELGRHAEITEPVVKKENKGGYTSSIIYPKYQLITFHTARRSFATNLYNEGAPTLNIMKLTGHTTETNFLKYIKFTKEENAKRMKEFFKIKG